MAARESPQIIEEREGGEPLLFWRSSGERTEALVAEDVWQVNICQSAF